MAQLANEFSRLGMAGASLKSPRVRSHAREGYYDAELKFTPGRIPDLGSEALPGELPIYRNGPSIFISA